MSRLSENGWVVRLVVVPVSDQMLPKDFDLSLVGCRGGHPFTKTFVCKYKYSHPIEIPGKGRCSARAPWRVWPSGFGQADLVQLMSE